VLSVWAAADGGLARVRLPGGRLDVPAAHALADAAAELGSGALELTVRGNIQLRGLPANAEADLARRLRIVGLLPSDRHDRVRNILASPLSGLLDPSRPDVGPLLTALDAALIDDDALGALPGRFLFCLDDGSGDVAALGADVTLLAGADRWSLLLAGVDVRIAVPGTAAAASLAIGSATAFLDERAAQRSPAWRLSELQDGPARVAARLRAAGAAPAEPAAPVAVPDRPRPTPLGARRQHDGRVALTVAAPGGHLSAPALHALAAAASSSGLRVTPWRSVVLPDLAPADVQGVLDALRPHHLHTDPERVPA
jgi:precorrin-3B synthase